MAVYHLRGKHTVTLYEKRGKNKVSFARLVFRQIQVTFCCYSRFVHNILEGF